MQSKLRERRKGSEEAKEERTFRAEIKSLKMLRNLNSNDEFMAFGSKSTLVFRFNFRGPASDARLLAERDCDKTNETIFRLFRSAFARKRSAEWRITDLPFFTLPPLKAF